MSPYMLQRSDSPDRPPPPILASIGTTLIDSFDAPPRPTNDVTPASAPDSVAAHYTPLPASQAALDAHIAGLPISAAPTAQVKTATSSRGGVGSASASGSSTPQGTFAKCSPSVPGKTWDVIGGGALYTLIGARMWLSPEQLRTVVDRAPESEPSRSDLTDAQERALQSFGEDMWVWNRSEGTRMVRARIQYEGDKRSYEYIHRPYCRSYASLLPTPLYDANYLHVAPPFGPSELRTFLAELREADDWSPRIVFEPTPPSCHAGERAALEAILGDIDVLSPNHEELFSFYSLPRPDIADPRLVPTVEGLVKHLLALGVGPHGRGTVVIRCGRLGSCVGTRRKGCRWYPAYFAQGAQDRVVDVTGAGNSYLGGFVAGLHLTGGDPYQAALYATVSSSFVVEQFGLPQLAVSTTGTKPEKWNGESPQARLASFRARLVAGGE